MKLKLFLLLTMLVSASALWAQTGVQGTVIDAKSGLPVVGATVMLDNQGNTVTTGPSGDFLISDAQPGGDVLLVIGYGYKDCETKVEIPAKGIFNVGVVRLTSSSFNPAQSINDDQADLVITESQLEDEEGNTQAVATLSGASDNPFYQAASYNFSVARFRIRGYNSEYTQQYINGVYFNDAARGRFNFSMLGGLNQAFKSKAIGMGLDTRSYALGEVGGANNISTYAKDYAPGFRGSVAYTNSNYRWRGMATYSTGLMPNGWAVTLSAIGRYAGEGVIPGSFYKSWGYFLAVQKEINAQHSIALTTFGAPTRRASNSATFEECYRLTGNNLYNSNWGWQGGKKRNAREVEAFDPTVILNWLWKPNTGTTLNTGVAFHKSFYASSAINWYNSADPRPDYYRYLPSYYESNPAIAALYTDLWTGEDDSFRQLNWDKLYQINYLNEMEGKGSSYIVENRHSNQASWQLNTNLNMRLTDQLALQGGAGANYTCSSYYKTVKDLLGGTYWSDFDQFAERDFPENPDMAQNDLNNPNRKVGVDDRFGYDYNINQVGANLWLQNSWTFAKWDLAYGATGSFTQYQREGFMRNGRAPENSFGKGATHTFFNYGAKASVMYKIDGRNSFVAHGYYGTRAPLSYNAYVSPRIKDDVISNLNSEIIASGDISYEWNYRNFKGVVTGFYTDMRKGTEHTAFYDDLASTFMNYALTNVHKVFKGVEVGLSYKLTSSLTVSAAANIGRYQYKNRPTGTRSYENGSQPDVTQTVYLKNYYVSGTPQEAYSLAFKYAGPHMWFFELNGAWMNRAYVDLSPVRHEALPDLWKVCSSEAELEQRLREISTQDKFNEALVINMSLGKLIYLSRSASLNLNLSINNLLDNRNIQTGGYQQGRFDYKNFSTTKYPNKYYYAQGIRIFVNAGVRF
jgi:hypothetical protein